MSQACSNGELTANYMQQAVELAERALDDIVTTGGVNAALLTGNLTVRNVAGIVSRGRPAITAFGGPRADPATSGLSVTWPYFDGTLTDFVGAQSAQKAEITSAAVDIKLGTEALVTYAGGADIAYQLIRQGDPGILDIYGSILLTACGVVTDAAFVTELETRQRHDRHRRDRLGRRSPTSSAASIDASLAVADCDRAAGAIRARSPRRHSAKAANLIAAASNQVVTNGTLDLRG